MPVTAPNILDISVCQANTCELFNIYDVSGVYSTSNSGGYGTPNFAVSDAIDATVVITTPNNTTFTITVFPTFPDSTGTALFTVTNTMLNITGSLPDGIYTIVYSVNFNNSYSQTVVKTVTKTILLSCSIWCAVQNLIAKIPVKTCDCNDIALDNALLAFGLYQSLIYNGRCGNVTNVTNLLTQLTKLTSALNCGCN